MDTVRVEGVTYTKVAAIAKKFRYTTDYVGQLCRSGKVDCQFVGRAWYVSEESLLKHKDGRYVESRVSDKTSNINTEVTESTERISVSPRLKKVTAKQFLTPPSHFLTRLEAGNSKYYADEAELLPQPLKAVRQERILPNVSPEVLVTPAEAVSVRVTTTTKPKKLAFTDVPEVALRGHLAVHEVEIQGDSEYVTADQLAHLHAEEDVQEVVDLQVDTREVERPNLQRSSVSRPSNSKKREIPTRSFTPQAVAVAASPSRLGLLLAVAILSSSIFAVFLISASQVFVIDGSQVSATIMFSLERVFELL